MSFDYKEFWAKHPCVAEAPDWIGKVMPYVEGMRVLELGCGDGVKFGGLFRGREYLGVDINNERIQTARKNYPKMTFEQKDINDLEFKKDSFDIIFSAVSLQHITPDKIDALAKNMRKWAPRIVLIETRFNDKSQEYCFNHDYESLFNIKHSEVVEEHPEGNMMLMVHEEKTPKVPKLSVVMPNYNKEAWLADAIESVINNTFKSWELIIVDDGSTDHSVDIIKHYQKLDPRIRSIFLPENMGIAYARNAGTALAQSDIIVVHDSDDYMYVDRLHWINRYFKRDDCDLFYSDYVHCNVALVPKIKETFKADHYDLLYPKQLIGHFTCAYRKWVWEKHPYDPERRFNDDYPFLIACYNDTEVKFKHCPQVIAAMRLLKEGESIKNLKETNKEVEELAKTIKKRDDYKKR